MSGVIRTPSALALRRKIHGAQANSSIPVLEGVVHADLRAGSLGTAAVQRARCLERSDAPVVGRDQ